MGGSRRPIVAGNWKMHKSVGEAIDLAAEVKQRIADVESVEAVVCPPFTALKSVGDLVRYSGLNLGAQDVHPEPGGAFTGEISVAMLQDLGCRYVIVGHSERRAQFGERDCDVLRKAQAVLAGGMCPIICIGETLEQRETDRTEAVLCRQIDGSMAELGRQIGEIVVAYEPVWAIGTGRTATGEQAQAAHALIRSRIGEVAGDEIAAETRIVYGGSVNPANAAALFELSDVDGGLVGGASLQAEPFSRIVHCGES